jgi:hypothetical protein
LGIHLETSVIESSVLPLHSGKPDLGRVSPMNYSMLNDLPKAEMKRGISNLKALRAQLSAKIPAKDAEDNLLLATWNIRDLGKAGGGWGYGERLPESYFYIAEILSRFDFIAVQEVNELAVWNSSSQASDASLPAPPTSPPFRRAGANSTSAPSTSTTAPRREPA